MNKLISNSKKSGIKDLPKCAIVKNTTMLEIAFVPFVVQYDVF